MNKSVALSFVALTLVVGVAAGCGSAGNLATSATGTPTPSVTGTVQCVLPAGEAEQMVFPQNNSSAAANLQGVVIAVAPNPLPTNWFIYAIWDNTKQSTYGTSSIGYLATPSPSPSPGATTTPTPLPTPSDQPTFAASYGTPIYESANLGTFANSVAGAQTFTIYLANTTCNVGIQQSTFTTATVDTPTSSPSPTASPT